jgi:hypothetical protein
MGLRQQQRQNTAFGGEDDIFDVLLEQDAKEKFQIEERFWYSADLRAKYIARVPHPKLLVLSNY